MTYGIGIEEHDKEGRIITLEFEKFFLVNCYTPNSKKGLERLDYRMLWEDEIKKYHLLFDTMKTILEREGLEMVECEEGMLIFFRGIVGLPSNCIQ